MSNNKITIEQAKQQITEGFSSILTREDVLHLLDCLEVKNEFEISKEDIDNLSSDIAESLQSEGTNLVDDYELSMSYKEVELDSIDFDTSKIKDAIEDVLTEYVNQSKK